MMRVFDAQVVKDYLSNALPEGGINSTPQQSPMNRIGLFPEFNSGFDVFAPAPSGGTLANNISMAIPQAVRPVIAQQLQQTASNLNSGIASLIGDTLGTQGYTAMQGTPVMQSGPFNNLRKNQDFFNRHSSSENPLGSLGNIMNMT